MRIAVIQPRVSYFSGGGEKIPLESISHLVDILEDISFDLYTTKSPLSPAPGYELFKSKTIANKRINIYEIPTPKKYEPLYDIQPGENRYRWDAESLYFNNLVYEQINKNKPDLILAYYLPDCISKPQDIPSILYLLGYPRTESEYREAMLAQYDVVISISQNTLDQWNNRLAIKINSKGILHQGLDLTTLPSSVPDFDSKTFNILFAGRLIERKGVKTLLEAVQLLSQQENDFKLRILGEGPMLPEIKTFISNNNIGDRVILEGFKANVLDYIRSADLCIFPSYEGEGLMNVVLESMYYNGLVVTTLSNGNEEAIKDGYNGFLVKPNDPVELMNKIVYIKANLNSLSKIRQHAKATISENFTWEKHANDFYKICNELLNGRSV